MKNYYYIIISIIFFTSLISAQNEIQDSLTATPDNGNNFYRNVFFLTKDNYLRIIDESLLAKTNILTINDPSTIQLRTKFAIMNGDLPYNSGNEGPSDLLHPYYEYYLQKQSINLLYKVIGMAQLGAVGYLAYKHIKKYGLLH